jgi:hypothetical protein
MTLWGGEGIAPHTLIHGGRCVWYFVNSGDNRLKALRNVVFVQTAYFIMFLNTMAVVEVLSHRNPICHEFRVNFFHAVQRNSA